MQRRITEKYALPRERLVDGLGTRKRVMTQDDLYSHFPEHVETIYLAIYHQMLNWGWMYITNQIL